MITNERINAHQNYLKILDDAKIQGCYRATKRLLAQKDLFFLLCYILHRPDINNDWLFNKCRVVQQNPNFYLDLWARGHYKSTIITFGLTIQDILNDPELTIGIFSFVNKIAKSFLRQIKTEFEINNELKELFPDILYENPKSDATKWSEDDGIIVKRKSNPREATIEASGITDGMPTSRHYKLRVYDDIITEKSVTTPDMIKKTTECWALSQNLSADNGIPRVVGTRYHFADTYQEMIDRKSLSVRLYPATDDGKETGNSVLLSNDFLKSKRRDMGSYIFSCQMLLKPIAEADQEFKLEWIRYWNAEHYNDLDIYIICDPAGSKEKTSDYSVFTVWGLGRDGNYYLIEWIRDRMNLSERANVLFNLHRTYKPKDVLYEKYGMQSDIEHFEDKMCRDNYRFDITTVSGQTPKKIRIRKMVPLFEQGRVYLPHTCIRVNLKGYSEDLTRIFIHNEYLKFPFPIHDDIFDCMARITEVSIIDTEILEGSESSASIEGGW